MEVTRSEQENDRNHVACPKCKSTDLDFKGLRNNMRAEGEERGAEPDVEVVSATYSWKCKKCKQVRTGNAFSFAMTTLPTWAW
jgi:ribosomal protein L37AE/L43A